METVEYITLPQLAELLGISRIAVFKKVKKNQIKAIRIGKNYAIEKSQVNSILGKELNSEDKLLINNVLNRLIQEQRELFKLLAQND
jgi:excisionase family DNA binding protein